MPVVATDGHSYELSAISDVFSVGNGQSPLTYANPHLPLPLPLTGFTTPNPTLTLTRSLTYPYP